MTWLALIDYTAVAIFALTGALSASRAQLDPVGFMFLSCLVGIGGGTVRDMVLDRAVFWLGAPSYILVACAAAGFVFFTAHLLESRIRVLIWLDSLALAAAVSAGAGVALQMGHGALIVMVIGVMTGCLGGLMRDVVVNEVPLVLRHGQLYASAALAGAAAGWATAQVVTTYPLAPLLAAALVTWVLRAGSLWTGWGLPTYRHGPPKQ